MKRRSDLLAGVVLGAIAATMLAWGWGTWPHAFVDFGRELYVPWRIAEGEVLYRDLAWFNGPLSAYANAALFALFGPGLWVLVSANLALTGLLSVLLYTGIARLADRTAAFVSTAVFLVLFAFDRIDAIGNDNYLTPYSHEVVHGLLLSLLAITAQDRLRARPRLAAAVAGGLLGLVALTKAEIFVAAAAALVCALVLDAHARRRSRVPGPGAAPVASIFAAAALLPGVLAFGLLSLAMPADAALRATLGAWPALVASDVTSQYFYRATIGVVAFGRNVTHLFHWSLAWAGVLLPLTLIGLRVRPAGREPFLGANLAVAAGVFGAALVPVLYLGGALHAVWPEILRPLPVLLAVLCAGALLLAWREPDPGGVRVLRAAWLVFAALLMLKIVLRVRLDQYGFALAMPATLLVIAALTCWLPVWVTSRGGDGAVARSAVLGVVAAVVLALLPGIGARFAERSVKVGSGRDAFLADERTGPVVDAALTALAGPGHEGTLAVLPEGVMLDYLARRVNPTGHVNFMPPELLIFGEDRILEAFRRHPPDWIALTHKDTREYGVGFFGEGYGRALYGWVERHYEPRELFGDPPLSPESRFGIRLLRLRREPR